MGGEQVHEALLRRVLPSASPRGTSGWIDAHVMPSGREPYYARAVQMLALTGDDELLDVACGVGRLLAAHATRARYVAGLDHSPDRVARARRRLADRIAAGTAEVVLGDATALPWPDGRFSAVSCVFGLDVMPRDAGAVVAELHRVLRPGGRAVLTMGMRFASEAARDRYGRLWYWSPTEQEAVDLLRGCGFVGIRVEHVGPSRGMAGVMEELLDRVVGIVTGETRLVLARVA